VAGLVPDPVVCLDPAQDLLSQLPPRAVRVSLAEARALLRALLPLPTLDVAALAWVAYQQRRKTAAYRSHRKRRLLALQALGP
jgi:hypothetical protein